MIKEHRLNNHNQLIIYEIGAGNGTLMKNIMDYIKTNEPLIYEKTIYNIIEISSNLSKNQTESIGTHKNVVVSNRSILDWKTIEDQPCFFLALEVLVFTINEDNLSHDLVRYDTETLEPVQGVALISEDGNFEEAYEPLTDPLLIEYLETRKKTSYKSPVFPTPLQNMLNKLNPMPTNLTKPEFVPSNAYQLIKKLRSHFPNHRVVMSDFHSLPDTIEGVDAPVVQTRYKHSMVACSTYLVQPGRFDIFFPTNFELFKDVYKLECDKDAVVMSHRDFLQTNADLKACNTVSGENPMLEYYENVSFITS